MTTHTTPKQHEIQQARAVGIEPRKSWTAAQIRAKREAEESRIKRICQDAIRTSERYSGCFFWTNTGNASSRRREELDTEETFQWRGQEITVNQSLSISCKNYYFRSVVLRDGSKSNMSYLKNIERQLR